MGDYSDASFELFGDHATIATIVGEFTDLLHPESDATGTISYVAPDLVYGREDSICNVLRGHRVAYEFFQLGDYEYEPRIRLYHPDVPESFGYQAAAGEWRGSANTNGEPLVSVSVIDRILDEMPEDADDVWLRERFSIVSAASWRARLDELRGRTTARPATAGPRPGYQLAAMLAAGPQFTYVQSGERYVAVLAVSYDHDADPTDTGDRIASPRDAAHWALDLTRDGGSAATLWTVFDRVSGEWTILEQHDIEEA